MVSRNPPHEDCHLPSSFLFPYLFLLDKHASSYTSSCYGFLLVFYPALAHGLVRLRRRIISYYPFIRFNIRFRYSFAVG
jgi:hypothetical protein